MTGTRSRAVTVLTVGGLLVAVGGVAQADVIYNNLDASVDAVAEVMPLDVGGPDGTTTLYLDERNGDGKNGCNLIGSTTLVVSFGSSDTDVATVSPSSVTFASCGDMPVLTVTPVAIGTVTIAASQTSNTSAGTFDLVPATFTVHVAAAAPSNTAPTVVVAGVTIGGSYAKGSVPSATCSVTDAEDGPSSFAATLTAVSGPYASDGIGSQTAGCAFTDSGGVTASSSVTYSIADPSVPSIGYTLSPADPDGSDSWYTTDVSLVWTVTEPESLNSLVMTGCVDQSIITDQAADTYSCSASSAGGSAPAVDVTIKRDGTSPSVSYTSASGTAGTADWYTSAVTATFTGTDALSGPPVASQTATSAGEGAAVLIESPAFTDNAGNITAAGAASQSFPIDLSDPTGVAFVGGPAGGSSHYFGSVPGTPTCTADDAVSGVASCDVSGYSDLVGSHTLTATATDNAGRTATATRTYTVLAWTDSGFYQPVDMGGVLNVVRGGSTVPLKFEVFAGSTELTSTSVVQSFTSRRVDCTSGSGLQDAVEVVSTGGTSLRYDSTGGQFIQNWKTPTGAGSCFAATMTTVDGSSITALFKLK